ncbi:hypothetical protein CFOL_v3_04843 [Cephalotus follicularis]|uniref:Uncharacterized protein n=1 Tax=Cephalotus follicularis TaxID=3775 RepID=A0A1Q3AZY0_CEPFO|nr:hypothetical protein CFOL_v3_04843 [Cephalotus follicularis]
MQRSSSTPRVSDDDFFIKSSPSLKQSSINTTNRDQDQDQHHQQQLPTYNPLSHVALKDHSRLRSAENFIHIIPIVLLLCAIILWFFSNPEQTTGFSHCKSEPTRFARMVNGKTRGHLSLSYSRRARSTDSGPELMALASFLPRTTASSNAQHAPWPRLGVIGCHASPTSTTLPVEAEGLMAGHSQRSTRGVLVTVSSGVTSIMCNNSSGQFLSSSFAFFFKIDGSVIFGPAKQHV